MAKENSGSACAFACIQSANEWLAAEDWKNVLLDKRNTPDDKKNQINLTNHSDNSATSSVSQSATSSNSVNIKNSSTSKTVLVPTPVAITLTLIQEINASGWQPLRDFEKQERKERNESDVLREKEKEIEDAERREFSHIAIATAEACRRNAVVIKRKKKTDQGSNSMNTIKSSETPVVKKIPRSDAIEKKNKNVVIDSDDEVELEESILKLKLEPSLSARGVWHYTVGLVGKPSAGTVLSGSTFSY